MRTVNERIATLEGAIRAGMDSLSKQLRCACPAIVQSWNASQQTVTAKLALKEIVLNGGAQTETELPLLVDVPVIMPRAGGYCLLMTPKAGDECLVIFSDMCIDAWWQSGGIQSQAELRRHDLSDGFAIMGCWSQVKKPAFPSDGLRLQNDAGTSYVSVDSTGVHFLNADIGIKDIDSNDNGVAVGQNSTATASSKKFEVAKTHTSYLYGSAQIGTSGDTDTGDLAVLGTLSVAGSAVLPADTSIAHEWLEYTDNELTGVSTPDSTNEPVLVTKIGQAVYMQGVVRPVSQINANSTLTGILTLPEGYRPYAKIRLPIFMATNTIRLDINTDGTVDIVNFFSVSIANTRDISLACSFVGGY